MQDDERPCSTKEQIFCFYLSSSEEDTMNLVLRPAKQVVQNSDIMNSIRTLIVLVDDPDNRQDDEYYDKERENRPDGITCEGKDQPQSNCPLSGKD